MQDRSWTVLSLLDWGTEYFKQKEVRNPRFSIEWLLSHVLEVKRLDLYLLFERPLHSTELERLRPMVQRRGKHEPLQYITGRVDFFGIELSVASGVLIPRPETEELVEYILASHDNDAPKKLIDIGTGSGCIALAIKKERPNWEVWATDLSESALRVAQQNGKELGLQVHWFQDNLFAPELLHHHPELAHSCDILVSNPPYILNEEWEALEREVREFEPEEALFCSSTHRMYSALVEHAKSLLLPHHSQMYFEVHEQYANEVQNISKDYGFTAEIRHDLAGKDRFVISTLTSTLSPS
jgi:release factor glutamine methyltransferase